MSKLLSTSIDNFLYAITLAPLIVTNRKRVDELSPMGKGKTARENKSTCCSNSVRGNYSDLDDVQNFDQLP